MEISNYQVILTGETNEGASREKAVEGFAKLFKMNVEKAESVMGRAPIAIKKDLDEATAKKYASALQKVGLAFEIKAPVSDSLSDSGEDEAAENGEAGDSKKSTRTNPIVEPEKHLGLPFTIEGRPDYSYLTVHIPADETIKVEASAMAAMDSHIRMKTKLKGGFGRFLTGESLFINEFTAEHAEAEIGIAPATPGDLTHQYLDGETLFLQNSAFVAATMGVNVESKWQGMVKGFFSGENLFLIRCSGAGDLWFNTYGAMMEIDVTDDYVVDTGNIVAFTEGLDYKVTKVGGYKSLFFSGEGFVCRFSGRGKVWIQTRSAAGFAAWARMYRPTR